MEDIYYHLSLSPVAKAKKLIEGGGGGLKFKIYCLRYIIPMYQKVYFIRLLDLLTVIFLVWFTGGGEYLYQIFLFMLIKITLKTTGTQLHV